MPDREKEEETAGFKVTDRRLFTSDGQLRRDVEIDKPKEETAPPKRPPAESATKQAMPEPPGPEMATDRTGPITFEHLVMSLATTAMLQLGLVNGPGSEHPPVDLPAARETIDLLEILYEKTKGNLTEHEEDLLSGSLYELRMAFVKVSGSKGRGR